jgi:colicin import membrane protein
MTSLPHILSSGYAKDKSLFYIALAVILAHIFLIIWAALTTAVKPQMPSVQRRLVVQTVSLSPQPQVEASADKAAAIKPVVALEEEFEEPLAEKAPFDDEAFEEDAHEEEPAPVLEKTEVLKPQADPKPILKQEAKTSKAAPAKAPQKQPSQSNPKKKEAKSVAPVPAKQAKPQPAKPSQAKEPAIAKPTEPPKAAAPAKPAASKPKPPAKKADNPPKDSKPPAVDKQAMEKQKKLEAEQKAQKARQQQLLADAQERIAKIAKNRDNIAPGKGKESALTIAPVAITGLEIEALPGSSAPLFSEREIGYRDELAGRLKLLLRLPEYGEVKIKLTLEKTGKVANVVVVSSESSANKKYIEKELPSLSFPPFGTNFNGSSQYTFAVTLSNE